MLSTLMLMILVAVVAEESAMPVEVLVSTQAGGNEGVV